MKIKEGLKIRSIAGEKVLIMHGRVGVDLTKLVSFNSTAEWLWDSLINKEFEVDDVISLLMEQYQIDYDIAIRDAHNWIEQLLLCKALEI